MAVANHGSRWALNQSKERKSHMKRVPYAILVAGLLALATPSLLLASIDQQKQEPVVRAVAVCKLVNPPPPDAKPFTTTLDCGWDFALEFPQWFAIFRGEEFHVDTLDNGKHQLSKEQPPGSEVIYSPPCPPVKKDRSYDDARAPLQKAPCNPELTPQ